MAAWSAAIAQVILAVGAQAADSSRVRDAAIEILIYLMVLVGLGVIVGIVGYRMYRRATHEEPEVEEGFTLAQMRRLHREGQLSDEEFEQARARIIAAARRAMARDEEEEAEESQGDRPAGKEGEADDDVPREKSTEGNHGVESDDDSDAANRRSDEVAGDDESPGDDGETDDDEGGGRRDR